MPDAPALFLGIADALERLEKEFAGVHHAQIDAEMPAKRRLDLVAFVQSEQTMIDEDAGEPVAHRPVDQCRSHRRVHASGEAADDPCGARQRADAGRLRLDEVPRRPVGHRAANVEQEGADDLAAPRGVRHFGMELHRIDRLRGVFNTRNGAIRRCGREDDIREAGRPRGRRGSSRPPSPRRVGTRQRACHPSR